MQALIMQNYNKSKIVECFKITDNYFNVNDYEKKIKSINTKDFSITQKIILSEGNLTLSEISEQITDRFASKQKIDINLKKGDILISTPQGYKVNLLPLKILTKEEAETCEKYNKLGETNG